MLVQADEVARVSRHAAPRHHPVRAAVQRDCWHPDRPLRRQAPLDFGEQRVAGCQPEAMPVGVDHDVYEVWVVEARRRPLEGRVQPP
jgi:hypothetical protein